MTNRPIFYDPTGTRRRILTWTSWILAVTTSLLCVAFVTSLFVVSAVPQLTFRDASHIVRAPAFKERATQLAREAKARKPVGGVPLYPTDIRVGERREPAASSTGKPLIIAFYANWDDGSYSALRQRLPQLDWVVPTWLSLGGPDMALHEDIDRRGFALIRKTRPDVAIIPLLQNAVEGKFEGPGLARLLADPVRRLNLVSQIVAFVEKNHLQGIMVDFETVPPEAQPNLKQFMTELSAAFRPHDWLLSIDVPFDDETWDYAAYAKIADHVVLMAYDEHWEEGVAGPIASQPWFERVLEKRMKTLDPAHTIIAIGNYGYDWIEGEGAQEVSFGEAMLSARDSEAEIGFDDNELNPHFSFLEDDGKTHNVWFLDGVTAFNQIRSSLDYAPAGYALWRLGTEDPSIWSVLTDPAKAKADDLKSINVGQGVDFEGSGEILRITRQPEPGARTIETDNDTGLVSGETYTKLPTSYVIQRVGETPEKVALTFDDGPDPVWTPRILDILKQKNVKASFFIIGENAESNPGLVERMVAEGHDVGNHSFTHPNLGEASSSVVELELNATQRLFQAITGRSMRLFRPPYFGDAEPTSRDEVSPIERAQAMGYVTVGLRNDPDDWMLPSADRIISEVLAQLHNPNPDERGQIVLLHDGGGDRSRTVEALGPLIDRLRADGYQIVPVSTLAGLTTDQAMPRLPADTLEITAARPMFYLLGWLGHALHALLIAAIILGFARLLFMLVLALWNRRREAQRKAPALTSPYPVLSVIIPAFNEEKVIASSVARILESDYPSLEVIIVDDGSTDGTSAAVSGQFASDARVRLLTLPNAGKANAVNSGLKHATGDIVVALDADTQFERTTISRLARWFSDPSIGAVAGNAKVGNRVNTITRWQALEYVTAQNLERRALAALDCITVVPGAVGAWRRSMLTELGGFPSDTLAEDQDLTIAVQKAGYRVMFDADAIAWTEAPDTLAGLARQRFRWAYGTLQCLWKHADMLFRAKYGAMGWLALPQVWLFQIILSAISPLVDFAFIWQSVATLTDWLQHGDAANADNLVQMQVYYALFLGTDLAACACAFALEKKEQWSLLWWLALQRFGYRQLMYYVVIKSVIAAVSGPFVGWGKLERKASVSLSDQSKG